jgi:hypothetical protein
VFNRFFVSELSLEIIFSQLPVSASFEAISMGCTTFTVYNCLLKRSLRHLPASYRRFCLGLHVGCHQEGELLLYEPLSPEIASGVTPTLGPDGAPRQARGLVVFWLEEL